MVQTKTCINVYSELNEWIDFCIVIDAHEDFVKAEEIVNKAYSDWFDNETCEPITDYITRHLMENEIDFEIYFKDEKETEESNNE